ncbi:MAG: translation initiation factor [Candidatus Nanohaloarchaeota archaeon QJJ-9]|nr:translation initiation factor [Candidatus Nanohaloarchaeota archaeon QJJ-9]
MTENCPNCGLPKDICVCKDIAREEQKIEVRTSDRSLGKVMTVIEGLDDEDVDIGSLESKLKSKLACGGTSKEGKIELQGDHTRRIKDVLSELGFEEDSIEVH